MYSTLNCHNRHKYIYNHEKVENKTIYKNVTRNEKPKD